MKNEKIISAIIIIIGILILIPIIKHIEKEDKKAIDYCLNQGYSYVSCTDFKY